MSVAGRFVVATAGHVDHGKSTLVRALTGIEPDRWAEEHRRGLTIDLGFAWTALPSGREIAFVDVPGHQRFLGNMLAGLGPAPVVCFLVAADAGWSAQSTDHRDAIAALGIRHGVVVISRVDRAPEAVDAVLDQARRELAGTELADAPAVAVSAATGTGLAELRATLDSVLAAVPAPPATGRVRLWVDRSFSIGGAGTVVTGTLAAGTVGSGDTLQLGRGRGPDVRPVVRGLQSRGEALDLAVPVDRVAVNLRGVHHSAIRRGDVLLTPDAWPHTDIVDIGIVSEVAATDLPQQLTLHIGTATAPARLRPLGDRHARLTLADPLPLVAGDRLVLRDPGGRGIVGGAIVLDAEPLPLRRRGDGARRARELSERTTPAGIQTDSTSDVGVDLAGEVARRGAVTPAHLTRLGLLDTETAAPAGVLTIDRWWVHEKTWTEWTERLRAAVAEAQHHDPLTAGLSLGAAGNLLALPDPTLLPALAAAAGVEQHGGYLRMPGTVVDLGPAAAGIAEVERRLIDSPFAAPEADELASLSLGTKELAAAERAGRILRLPGGVVLLPTAPALAMRELARLPQPFTTSQARQAIDTTRRVAIPLLEYLDAKGWTRRIDAGHRAIAR